MCFSDGGCRLLGKTGSVLAADSPNANHHHQGLDIVALHCCIISIHKVIGFVKLSSL